MVSHNGFKIINLLLHFDQKFDIFMFLLIRYVFLDPVITAAPEEPTAGSPGMF